MRKELLILILSIMASCQDVVDVDVPSEPPRLAIDALIRITDVTQTTAELEVRAILSSSFFGEIEPAQLSSLSIYNEGTGQSLTLGSLTNNGIYSGEWDMAQLTQGTLVLTVEYNNEVYEAKTQFVRSSPIDNLVQGDETLFSGDETEVVVTFTDRPNETNFYLFDFDFNEYLVSEDTFYEDQSFQFSYFYDEEVEIGRTVEVSILGIDESFFNYMNQLIVQSGGDQGPFQTPAATVKGNFKNLTNPENFALGYFAVSEIFSKTLTLE